MSYQEGMASSFFSPDENIRENEDIIYHSNEKAKNQNIKPIMGKKCLSSFIISPSKLLVANETC